MTAPAESVLRSGVGWLHHNLEWFDPQRWERFLPRRRFPASPLLELVVLLRCLRRGPFAELAGALVEAGLDLAERVTRRAEFREGLHRADLTFPYYAYLVCVLAEAGRDTRSLRDSVRSIVETNIGDVTCADRPAPTLMELRYVLDVGSIACPLPTLGELYPSSIVAARDTPLFFGDDDAYAVTHVLFYLTDFGVRPLPVDPAERERVRELVLIMLAGYLARGNLDLAGELMLCAETLGAHQHDLLDHGWRLMAGARRADGAVPSPLHDPAIVPAVQGEKRAAYLFGTCFHTTMVAAMAASERRRRALAE
ncbi:MAG TPA: hypothetical protein VGJ13_11680 [Pseudonocardiaceae bacterium]|jgi:hypothetical protein